MGNRDQTVMFWQTVPNGFCGFPDGFGLAQNGVRFGNRSGFDHPVYSPTGPNCHWTCGYTNRQYQWIPESTCYMAGRRLEEEELGEDNNLLERLATQED